MKNININSINFNIYTTYTHTPAMKHLTGLIKLSHNNIFYLYSFILIIVSFWFFFFWFDKGTRFFVSLLN